MVYIAKLVTVTKYKNISDKLKPFIHFHSSLDEVDISDDDQVAVLQIEGTESYLPIFLKTKPTLKQLEAKLSEQETKLNAEARKLLLEYMEEE